MITPAKDWRFEETVIGLLDNTLTVKVGDVVKPLTGAGNTNIYTNASCTGNGVVVFGVVVGFSLLDGSVIGQGMSTATSPSQMITTSTNTTVLQYCAFILPIRRDMVWIMDTSAAVGTTTGSDKPNVFFNLSDAHTVNEASIVSYDNDGSALQVFSFGPVPGLTGTTTSSTQIYGSFSKAVYNI
jgi:hypothetical protein